MNKPKELSKKVVNYNCKHRNCKKVITKQKVQKHRDFSSFISILFNVTSLKKKKRKDFHTLFRRNLSILYSLHVDPPSVHASVPKKTLPSSITTFRSRRHTGEIAEIDVPLAIDVEWKQGLDVSRADAFYFQTTRPITLLAGNLQLHNEITGPLRLPRRD